MKRLSLLLLVILALAIGCAQKEETTTSTAGESTAAQEKTYQLEGTIVSRDAAGKQLIIKHGDIGDWMKAMTMPFEVRDQDFASLPPDGTAITATVHATETSWWITDVKPAEGAPTTTDTTATAATSTDTAAAGTATATTTPQ